MKTLLITLYFICSCLTHSNNVNATPKQSTTVNLEIRKTKLSRPSYEQFCSKWKSECGFTEKETLKFHSKKELLALLYRVNNLVNERVQFMLDEDNYNSEEQWELPVNGFGDCEDNALEKRRVLKKLGYPAGAFSLVTAFHSQLYYAHAVLFIETNFGTFVLDQDNTEVLRWDETQYIYEAREIENTKWDYYVQNW